MSQADRAAKVTDNSLSRQLVLLETLMARPGYPKLILNEF